MRRSAGDAVAEFLAWLIGSAIVSVLISPVTYYLFNLSGHHTSYPTALIITLIAVVCGVVIIKVNKDGDVSL